jgi:chemotaxis protein MotB
MTTPMNLLRNPLSLLLIISALGACVPGRKYEESQSRLKAAEASASAAEARSIEATTALTEVQAQRDALRKELDDLAADTAAMGTEHRAFERKYTMLNQLNNELLDKYTKLMEGDRSENRKLLTDLETVRLRLMSKEDSLNSLGRSLADREAKLAELQAELEAKDKAMKGLKDRVSKALTGFEGKGLTVDREREGPQHPGRRTHGYGQGAAGFNVQGQLGPQCSSGDERGPHPPGRKQAGSQAGHRRGTRRVCAGGSRRQVP